MDLPYPSLPKTQTAVIAGPDGQLQLKHDVPLPTLHAGHVLVRVAAVALNPVDTKMVGRLATPGATSGFDFAGVVVASGRTTPLDSAVDLRWRPGTRVCGAVNGQNALDLREGSFAQYTTVPRHALLRIPDGMSLEEAATLGVGMGTVGLALFRSLQLQETPQTVLVYGGSTATGSLALQVLKMYTYRNGHHAITTCSASNFDLVRSRGAEQAFDYRSPTALADIRAATAHSLRYVLDCVTTAETIAFCQACMGRMGGSYTTLEPFPASLLNSRRIRHEWVLQPEVLAKPIGWPAPFGRAAARTGMLEWAAAWYETVQGLLDRGALKCHPVKFRCGGLEGLLRDMDMVRKRQVSGEKLVYSVDGRDAIV